MRFGPFKQIKFFFKIYRAHLFQIFLDALQPFFNLAEITDHQVEIDVFNIAQRIDRPHMRNGRIIECPHHVCQRVDSS